MSAKPVETFFGTPPFGVGSIVFVDYQRRPDGVAVREYYEVVSVEEQKGSYRAKFLRMEVNPRGTKPL
jgi:hypothetical protein